MYSNGHERNASRNVQINASNSIAASLLLQGGMEVKLWTGGRKVQSLREGIAAYAPA